MCTAKLSWPGGSHAWRWGGDVPPDSCVRVGTVAVRRARQAGRAVARPRRRARRRGGHQPLRRRHRSLSRRRRHQGRLRSSILVNWRNRGRRNSRQDHREGPTAVGAGRANTGRDPRADQERLAGGAGHLLADLHQQLSPDHRHRSTNRHHRIWTVQVGGTDVDPQDRSTATHRSGPLPGSGGSAPASASRCTSTSGSTKTSTRPTPCARPRNSFALRLAPADP